MSLCIKTTSTHPFQVLYIPFLVIMCRKDFWMHSCYKLMFLMGVFDFLATIVGGTLMGVFTMRGDILCTNETFLYTTSCFCASKIYPHSFQLLCHNFLAFWTAACMTGIILMLNRFLDLIKKELAQFFFGGNKIYPWMVIPFIYGAYFCIFTKPFLINTKLDSLFINPFVMEPDIKTDLNDVSLYLIQNCWKDQKFGKKFFQSFQVL